MYGPGRVARAGERGEVARRVVVCVEADGERHRVRVVAVVRGDGYGEGR